jgi:hypothetical protein
MKTNTKFLMLVLALGLSFSGFSQAVTVNPNITLNAAKVAKFEPFLAVRHSVSQDFPTWKSQNIVQYTNEMWYFSESFYIKRNVLTTGITLNEEIIDITRFDQNRSQTAEVEVQVPGYKDVIVLLPENQLLYNFWKP